jgi:hypothetical protein
VKRIPRPLALAALVLAVTGVTAGCSEFSEQTTTLQYTPSDGVQADLDGGVQVRNAFFVAEGADAPGTLVTTVVNLGDEDVTVMVTGDGINAEIDVPAREAVQVGPEGDEQIEVSSMNAVPGELVPLTVSTGAAAAELGVPVLSGDLPEYADLVPTSS